MNWINKTLLASVGLGFLAAGFIAMTPDSNPIKYRIHNATIQIALYGRDSMENEGGVLHGRHGKNLPKAYLWDFSTTEGSRWIQDRSTEQIDALEKLEPQLIVIGSNYFKPSPAFFDLIGRDSVVASSILSPSLPHKPGDLESIYLPIQASPELPLLPRLRADRRIIHSGGKWGSSYIPELQRIYTTKQPPANESFITRIPTLYRHEGRVVPSLFLRAIAEIEGVDIKDISVDLGSEVLVGSRSIPVDENGYFRIFFNSIPPVIAATYVHDRILTNTLLSDADVKGVRIYATSAVFNLGKQYARARTQAGELIDDTVLTAEAIETVMRGLALKELRGFGKWALILVFIAACAFLFVRGKPRSGAVMTTFLLIGALVAVNLLVFRMGYLIPILEMLGAGLTTAVIAFSITFTRERRERKRVRDRFSGYLSEGALRKLIVSGEVAATRGRRKEITAIFVHLDGLLPIVENLPAVVSYRVLGELLEEIAVAVFRHQATLDKLVLDTLFVFLNDPMEVENHEQKAVELSEELLNIIHAFVERTPEATDLKVGIGIETGEAVVGNLGSDDYLTYTAIGSIVNQASRLSIWAEPWTIAVGQTAMSKLNTTYFEPAKASLKGVGDNVPIGIKRSDFDD